MSVMADVSPQVGLRDFHLVGAGAVAELEDKLKKHYGMRYALCLSSGTAGLLGAALALDLKGEEFLTTPYTYGGSLAAWLLLGNRPVFSDINPHTLELDADAARKRISSNTRAILAVDVFGIPSDTEALRRLADEYGLWYVADAAQSFGAFRSGRPASAMADLLVLSFTAGKPLSAGEGGAILTNHLALYEKLVWFTQHPGRQRRDLGLHLDNEFAFNARIHPAAAEAASNGFEAALEGARRRRQRCFQIIRLLNESRLTEPVEFEAQGIEPSFFRLTAAWQDKPNEGPLCRSLAAAGFEVEVAPATVRPIYRQPAFLAQYRRRLRKAPRCPRAERQAEVRFCLESKMPTTTFHRGARRNDAGSLAMAA